MKMITFGQKWRRETMKMILPMAGGMAFAVVMTLVATEPTKWTFFWWGATIVGITGLAVWVGWVMAKRG